ncbi:hypothetical protein [Marinomonas fungiae]|uniref:Uncharacterized protein n=1 Tax=Marinomonas fungiae TaxID=1137284 RepID=A0A0K6ILX4_9GAMM|nr:hypothetical protein [Marinomonas fungiae]CUB04086.1 hypothetical protein Ga0061065_105178 [Marinomonas fungiae]
MKKLAIISIASLALFGCKTSAIKENFNSTFNLDEVSFIKEDGTNTITGNAFLRQRGGGVVTCAGENITLYPVTDYSSERMQYLYGSTKHGYNSAASLNTRLIDFSSTPDSYFTMTRSTICDSDGRFKLTEVPDGEYFVTATVLWVVKNTQGGYLMEKVSVSGGEIKDLIITHK